ncbi:DsbA family oxidoreductase [Actomonas aquatica]|uniref:DsbA family protein n=1 Tax=Actomonas aquatica TaxID=2866162 RepID=A0ABZ1C8J3_9BACT|nr:DsbA family protein [Opitutus sp. WL0086]WRQ86640.1 DsbA family protein [Opitutus sp. WL0086]
MPAASTAPITVTYYLEILSSWCLWAQPAWEEVQERFAGRVQFEWRIALMSPEAFPTSRAQCDWFYQRSGLLVASPFKLHSGWWEAERAGHYEAPNWVAEAGRDLLPPGDERIRLALARAAMLEGQKIGDLTTAAHIAAGATGLDADTLATAARSPAVQQRVAQSTATFRAHQIDQRPTFIVESSIGDKAVFAGLWQAAPLIAVLEQQLSDAARYASHAAHFGAPPVS